MKYIGYYRENVLNQLVSGLDISTRAKNCLRNYSIIYVGDLVQLNEAGLLMMTSLGKKCLGEIRYALNSLSLHLSLPIRKKSEDDTNLEDIPIGIETIGIRNEINKINKRLNSIEPIIQHYVSKSKLFEKE
tara:strand:- start:181 stop:573 length:393 start_codon:yes stop_codon:yes gene_type:complete